MDNRHGDIELIQTYAHTRDASLREELILRYIPLVHFVLGRLGLSQSLGADYEDAASQGLLGLIEAVDRYDLSYGTQFSTYATLRIRGKVIDHLRSLDWLSRGARKRARKVQDGISQLWESLQRMPSDEELASHLNMEVPKVQQALMDSSRQIVSLDALLPTPGEEEASFHEVLADEEQIDPAAAMEESELLSRLGGVIGDLPKREQLILSLYYIDELTFKEIGAVLEISELRVCQLHGRIVLKIRNMLANPLTVATRTKEDTPANTETPTPSHAEKLRVSGPGYPLNPALANASRR